MMDERQKRDRGNTYVPPTPESVKPKASRDNSVEMAAGGEHERKAMDAQREQMDDPGRTDNPRGTGVSFGGARSARYGNEEEGTRAANREPAHDAGTGDPRRQEELQHEQQTPPQKPGGSGASTGAQQSTGSMPPRQGAGSTPQSHTTPTPTRTEPSGNPTKVSQGSGDTGQHGAGETTPSKTANMKDQAQEKAADVKDRVQDKAADVTEGAQAKITDIRDQAQAKLDDAREQAQSTLDDVKGQVQGKLDDARTQAQDKVAEIRMQGQEKIDAVTGQAQDTLEGVRATLQTKTDQLVGSVTEKSGQVKQAATEKSAQAGERLTGLADTLREKTQTLEPDHPVANVATKAAGALEQTGTYLQEHTPDDWVGDLKRLIARKPIESVCVAAGLGYMAARAFRK